MKFYNMYDSLGRDQEELIRNQLGVNVFTPLSQTDMRLYTPLNELADIPICVERVLHTEFKWQR